LIGRLPGLDPGRRADDQWFNSSTTEDGQRHQSQQPGVLTLPGQPLTQVDPQLFIALYLSMNTGSSSERRLNVGKVAAMIF
jgi:hypothetical protein